MRSAKVPEISAGVMIANVAWYDDEQDLRDRRRERARRPEDAVHPDEVEAADRAADVGPEGERVAEQHPGHADERGAEEAVHDRREDVLRAHQAAIEEEEARDRHHQHERRAGEHPGGVAGVELRRRRGAASRGFLRPGGARDGEHAALRRRT